MNLKVVRAPELARDVRQFADLAVALAARQGDTLDYSEASVEVVERLLDTLADAFARGELPAEHAWKLCTALGSYLGEVFVRAHGGEWGVASVEGQDGTVACVTHPQVTFWPWVRAMKRVTEGDDDNIWIYYLRIASEADEPS